MLRLVHRPTRITRPLVPPAPEVLAPPPSLGDGPLTGIPIQTLLPVVGSLSSIVMIVVLRSASPVFMVVGAVVLVVALVGGVGAALSSRGQAARQRRTQRGRYLDFLERTRTELRRRGREVRARAAALDPEPAALPDLIRDPARLWERRRGDADFLSARIGEGETGWFGLSLPRDENPVQPFDPIMAAEARLVVQQYSAVAGMPVRIDLERAGHVSVIGDRTDVLAVARALVVQLASLHSPEDLHLALAHPAEATADWTGFDALPHAIDPGLYDGPLPARRVAPDAAGLVAVLGGDLADRAQLAATAKRSIGDAGATGVPRLVVLLDDWGRVASALPVPDADLTLADLHVTAVHLLSDRLHEPSDVTVRVTVAGGVADVADARLLDGDGLATRAARLDAVPSALFGTIAASLAPLRLKVTAQDEAESAEGVSIAELLGIADVAGIAPDTAWTPRSPRDFLRVPIGLDDFGAPVLLDLKESAELGMGPHGICIGATGSGKSEMLRTLVLGLALSHSPEDLAVVLVDYKGGAAFASFANLPHVAGIIDNLADDPQLTERARASIAGEVVRRQRVLRDAGNLASVSHYAEARRTRDDLPPLPHLLLVIDEFGELLTAEPEFLELLTTIGRIGRSIGVHLLLSSQRIEAGRLRGLDTYLSYRLGLRTFSEAESTTILDRPDAFRLPAIPGYAYLKVDTTVFRRFRAGYVSGPIEEGRAPVAIAAPTALELPPFNSLGGADGPGEEAQLVRPQIGRALVDEAVDRLAVATDRAVAPVWRPPLPARLALGRVLDPADPGARPLAVPLGLVDDPAGQQQQPWLLDLAAAGGHVAVIGAPQSGRSTLLRSLTAASALSTRPGQLGVYGIDFTGGGLAGLAGFPHVGGIATRTDPSRLQRLLEELSLMILERERIFRERGIDSPGELRRRHAAGLVPELATADVVLLVDGYGAVRGEFERFDEALSDLLVRGSGFGVHLVLALTRWNELRMSLQPLIGTRVELRLNDPADSLIDRRLMRTVRADQPGRALVDGGLFAQVALPVLEAVADADLAEALADLATQTGTGWAGPSAAPIRLLPTALDPAALPDRFEEPDRVPIGVRQDTMASVAIDLARQDAHLAVYGDVGCGKTTVLRGLITGLTARYDPDDLVVAVMDTRGGLRGACHDDYLGGFASGSVEARQLAASIAVELEKRRSTRSRGPRIVVAVDDLDILSAGGSSPLEPLLPHLPSARDLGLHVLLTRPVAGLQRALFDRGLQAVRESGASVLLMSGERTEGSIAPNVYAEPMVPGRGRLLRRGQPGVIVQIADFPAAPGVLARAAS